MFDPTVGRWLTEDPIGFAGGDVNLYRYVGNSPTNATDPSGLADPKQAAVSCLDSGRPQQGFKLSLTDPAPGTMPSDPLEAFIWERDKAAAEARRAGAAARRNLVKLQAMVDADLAQQRAMELRTPQFRAITPEMTRREDEIHARATVERLRSNMAPWQEPDEQVMRQSNALKRRDEEARWAGMSPSQRLVEQIFDAVVWGLVTEGAGMFVGSGLRVTRLAGGGARVARGTEVLELSRTEVAEMAGSRTARAACDAPAAPKTWQDFLPEAEARLAAAKAKYGDGAVAMAISRKQALNRIEGLINAGHPEKSIEAHIGKLTRPGSGPHIRTELKARLDEIERLATHTGGKTEQEIMKQVQDWRQRISEIPDVPH